MAIDFKKFLSWAEKRFPDVRVNGNEIKLNSIFVEDYKHHLWCNPFGGKKERPNGVFRCWKTDKKGSLVSLVMMVDKCSFEEALEILGGDSLCGDLQDKIDKFFSENKEIENDYKLEKTEGISIPKFSYKISEMEDNSVWKIESEFYCQSRKISSSNFWVCCDGDYKNRIIIPYYDSNKKLIYFNARLLINSPHLPKYMGPDKNEGIGKSDVIYMSGGVWPEEKVKIFITEGEIDAESLFVSGFNGVAIGGKEIYDKQIEFIRNYIPVIAVDTDKAGYSALLNIGNKLIQSGFKDIFYVRPPNQFKDWNEMLVKTSFNLINAYVNKNIKHYDQNTNLYLRIKNL